MASDVKWGKTNGAIRTTVGTQDFTDSNLGGLTPKAAIVLLSRITAADAAETKEDGRLSFGFTDGTNQKCIIGGSDNSPDPSSSYRGSEGSKLAVMYTHESNTDPVVEITFNSWLTNGVRLSVDVNSVSGDYLIQLYFLAGADVDQVYAGHHQLINAATNTITNVPFESDFLLTCGIGATTADAFGDNNIFHIGAAHNEIDTGHIQQSGLGYTDKDNAATGQPTGRLDSYGISGQVYNDGVTWLGDITSFTSTGFVVNSSADPGDDILFYLAVKFTANKPAISIRPTHGPQGVQSKTWDHIGFQPNFGFWLLHNGTGWDYTEAHRDGGISICGFDDNGAQSMGMASRNGTSAQWSQSMVDNNAIRLHAGNTTVLEGTHTQFLANGMQQDFTNVNDANPLSAICILFGDTAPGLQGTGRMRRKAKKTAAAISETVVDHTYRIGLGDIPAEALLDLLGNDAALPQGYALKCPGGSEKVTFATAMTADYSTTCKFRINLYFKAPTPGSTVDFLRMEGPNDIIALQVTSEGKFQWYVKDSGASNVWTSTIVVADNEWHKAYLTIHSGKYVDCKIDGVVATGGNNFHYRAANEALTLTGFGKMNCEVAYCNITIDNHTEGYDFKPYELKLEELSDKIPDQRGQGSVMNITNYDAENDWVPVYALPSGGPLYVTDDPEGKNRLPVNIVTCTPGDTPAFEAFTRKTMTAGAAGLAANDIWLWWGDKGAQVPANTDPYGADAVTAGITGSQARTDLETAQYTGDTMWGNTEVPMDYNVSAAVPQIYYPGGINGMLINGTRINGDIATEPVFSDFVANWDVLALVNQDLTSSWDTFQTVSSDRTLGWDTLELVSSDLSPSWDALNLVPSDQGFQWDVHNSVAVDQVTSWNVNNFVSSDQPASWDVLNLISQDIPAIWDVLNSLHQDAGVSWDVLNAVARDIAVSWNTLVLVNQDLSAGWDVLNNTYRDLSTSWDVIATQLVGSNLGISWDALNTVPTDLAISWDALNLVNSDRDISWDTLVVVGRDQLFSYNVLNPVMADHAFSYDVLNAVSADRSISWDTVAYVSSDLPTLWDVLNPVGSDYVASWDVLNTLVAYRSIVISWNVLNTVSVDNPVGWDVLQLVSQDQTLNYDVLNSVFEDTAFSYNVLNSISADTLFNWDVLNTISEDLSLSWNSLQSITRDLTTGWNVTALVHSDSTLEWLVLDVNSEPQNWLAPVVIRSLSPLFAVESATAHFELSSGTQRFTIN